jgi:arginine/ornithine N-succinyltransferase beta subunit
MNGALAVLEQMSFEEFMEAVAERVAGKIHPLEKGLTMTKPEVAKEMGFSEATLMRMVDAGPSLHRSDTDPVGSASGNGRRLRLSPEREGRNEIFEKTGKALGRL